MDRIEDRIRRLGEKPEKLISYMRIVLRIGGIILVIFSLRIGREKIHLLISGIRASGTIVDYRQADWSLHNQINATELRSVFMPIVEFKVDGRTVHFQDSVGSRVAGGLMRDVPIIFDRDEPEVGIIDRPILNFIPWAPMFVAGFLMLLKSFRRKRR